jgi:hypothetical protein
MTAYFINIPNRDSNQYHLVSSSYKLVYILRLCFKDIFINIFSELNYKKYNLLRSAYTVGLHLTMLQIYLYQYWTVAETQKKGRSAPRPCVDLIINLLYFQKIFCRQLKNNNNQKNILSKSLHFCHYRLPITTL